MSRQRAQKLHTTFETDIFLLPSLLRGTNFLHLFSKRWKFLTNVTKHFYTILPPTPSDKFCRNRFNVLVRKNSFNFLARKMIVSFWVGTSKDKIDDQYKFILKRMKVSYDHYETLLHVFTPNSVRQVLAKFLHLSLKELWTQNKRFQEWSKIRVSCFFWQIKVGKNKEFWSQANVFESNFTFQENAV